MGDFCAPNIEMATPLSQEGDEMCYRLEVRRVEGFCGGAERRIAHSMSISSFAYGIMMYGRDSHEGGLFRVIDAPSGQLRKEIYRR